MNCVFLTTPGEVVEAALHAMQNGYAVDIYPTTRDESALSDACYAASAAYLSRSPESAERPHVRSLRASFIRMLRDSRYRGDDATLFCESDATPMLPTSRLEPLVKRALEQNPDADVIRLFHHCEWVDSLSLREFPEKGVSFSRMARHAVRDACTPEFWGTHAMVIPARSREKVADVFSRYRLPTDVALSLANGRDELQVSVCSHNLFCQKNRVCKPRQRRIACLLPSYKRFKDLQRQIWCLMDQDTADFHLFVAVKGMAEADFQRLLLPQFSHFVEEGRLTLRLFPNRNQLSNLLDCVRGLDVSGFDLFAKLDDDDVYARDYLSLVQRFHSMLPEAVGSFYTGCGGYLRSSQGFPVINRGGFPCFGPTMVFPQEVLELLQQFEREPQLVAARFPAADQPFLRSCLGLHEDSLLHFFNSRRFACNRTAFIDVRQRGLSLLVCQDNPSVMRGGYLSSDQGCRMHSTSPTEDNDERLFLFRHPGWCGYVRLLGNRACNLTNGDGADVLQREDSRLSLKWDKWGEECFCRDASGAFVLEN